MRRHPRAALTALPAIVVALALAAPVAAQTTGPQTLKGVIVTSGRSGQRTLVSSTVVAKGVFDGAGRLIEVASLPGDPDNVARDDLVFADGTMHLVSTAVDFAFSLNPLSCHAAVTVEQTAVVAGGTGRFVGASGAFTGTVSGPLLLARDAGGSCAFDRAVLQETDRFESSGTLSLP